MWYNIINKRKLKTKWKIILVSIIIITLLLLYTIFINTKGLLVKEYKVVNKNIPSSFYGLKIVHFSDIYYGKSINKKELVNLVEEINLTKPDIVIFTGDLIDKDTIYTEDIEKDLIKYLSKINSEYGKYYVSGDNDNYKNSFDSLMTKSNFMSLEDTCDTITNKKNDSLILCGLGLGSNNGNFLDEIIDENNDNYKIIAMHYPDYYKNISKYDFNLILGGHSYNGQIKLPFIKGIIRRNNAISYYNEHYNIGNNDMYISGGLGTDNFNLRFLNKPSFNLYRLVDK